MKAKITVVILTKTLDQSHRAHAGAMNVTDEKKISVWF